MATPHQRNPRHQHPRRRTFRLHHLQRPTHQRCRHSRHHRRSQPTLLQHQRQPLLRPRLQSPPPRLPPITQRPRRTHPQLRRLPTLPQQLRPPQLSRPTRLARRQPPPIPRQSTKNDMVNNKKHAQQRAFIITILFQAAHPPKAA